VQGCARRELHAVASRCERPDHSRLEDGRGARGGLNSVWTEFRGARQEPFGQLSYRGGSIRLRGDFRNELFNLTLGLVLGSSEQHVSVLRSQVRRQLGDAGQVEAPIREQREKLRVLAGCPRDRDAQVGLVLREMEDVRAIDEHRRASFAGEQASAVYLADVGDDVRLGSAGSTEETHEPEKQVVVGKALE
jgi:hypothetical protein